MTKVVVIWRDGNDVKVCIVVPRDQADLNAILAANEASAVSFIADRLAEERSILFHSPIRTTEEMFIVHSGL